LLYHLPIAESLKSGSLPSSGISLMRLEALQSELDEARARERSDWTIGLRSLASQYRSRRMLPPIFQNRSYR